MKIWISIIALFFSTQILSKPKDKEERKKRFSSDTELSAIVVGGNSVNTSFSFLSRNRWPVVPKHILRFGGHFTYATDEETLDAQNWSVNLRYEWKFKPRWGYFVGTIFEVDKFAGYQRRDNIDTGFTWEAVTTKDTDVDVEAGYRYTWELDVEEITQRDHKMRLYGKWDQNFTPWFGFAWWVEFLPNFTRSEDYMINTEPSLWFYIVDMLTFKFGYLYKLRGLPPADRKKTDFTSTASLILKY